LPTDGDKQFLTGLTEQLLPCQFLLLLLLLLPLLLLPILLLLLLLVVVLLLHWHTVLIV